MKWVQAKFKQLGYDVVRLEPVKIRKWVRRSERGEVLGAHAQPLTLTALGGSPGCTVEGEVVRFADFASLEAALVGPGPPYGLRARRIHCASGRPCVRSRNRNTSASAKPA